MATARLTHDQREQQGLVDLQTSFPNFAGPCHWTKVPDGADPPDFLSRGPAEKIGLELIEWLDGRQMGPAKSREAQRTDLRRVFITAKPHNVPENFNCALLMPNWNVRLRPTDESQFRDEFFACIGAVDQTWRTNPDRMANTLWYSEFSAYPMLGRYLASIQLRKGGVHELFIDVEQDGGAFNPNVTVETLEQALDKKLLLYSQPDTRAKLNAHGLAEVYLLVHGGFNAYAYNTPAGHLSLEEISRRGSAYYANHPLRKSFSRVWFYDSLDSADEINQLLGFPAGAGRVRWLAELWPQFRVYPGSVGG
jgi:hypothetical protein